MSYISWSCDFDLYLEDYLVILNYLPISAFFGLLKFDIKMFVNISKVRYRPVLHSKRKTGASVYFGHIFSLWRNIKNIPKLSPNMHGTFFVPLYNNNQQGSNFCKDLAYISDFLKAGFHSKSLCQTT